MSILLFIILILVSAKNGSANIKIQRQLSNAGFHRNIETTLHLPKTFVKDCESCSLIMYETLSAGIYADPFQIKSLELFGGPQVYFLQSVDIEAAEFTSKPLELYIFLNISSFSQEVSKDVMENKIVLPIHARYYLPAYNDTHADVTILNPGLYTNCSTSSQADSHTISAPCDKDSSHMCMWLHLPYESRSSHLTMKVPIGQTSQKALVIVGTLLISVVISAVLTNVILSHGM